MEIGQHRKYFCFWFTAEVSRLCESWIEKLMPSFLFKSRPQMGEERLVTIYLRHCSETCNDRSVYSWSVRYCHSNYVWIFEVHISQLLRGINVYRRSNKKQTHFHGSFLPIEYKLILKCSRRLVQAVLSVTTFLFTYQTTTKSLLVHITDVNDNSPVFTEPEGYYFAVDEGKAGLTVGMVTVSKTHTYLVIVPETDLI